MRTMRRLALWVGLPLVVVLVAGWTWYRMSDTGKRWRFEDRLSSYCGGLLPAEQTAALTGLSTDSFKNDIRRGGTRAYYEFCWAADQYVTVSRVPDGVRGGVPSDDVHRYFPHEPAGALPGPAPLRGGWRGYTDVQNTVAALPCRDGGSVVVTAQDDEGVQENADGTWPEVDRDKVQRIAELATATAVRAAGRWGCAADAPAGPPRIPALHAGPDRGVAVPEGACAGLDTGADERIGWTRGSADDPHTTWETCTLGTHEEAYQGEDEGVLYSFSARYGTEALADRIEESEYAGSTIKSPLYGSARCPGDRERARFTAHAQDDTAQAKRLAATALKTFARHAADRHGCTGLRIPG